MIASHVFESSGEAYDCSQTCDAISDGDVLLVPSEGRVAVLVEAWPVIVGAGHPGPAFHILGPDVTFRNLHGGKYLDAAIVGTVLLAVECMKTAGLGANPDLLGIAKAHNWAGEIPPQERFAPHA